VPNFLGRIDAIWAALSLDEGGEGVCAAPIGGMTLPLIAADKRRLDQIIPIARRIAELFNKPVRLAKFTRREDVEIYQPRQTDAEASKSRPAKLVKLAIQTSRASSPYSIGGHKKEGSRAPKPVTLPKLKCLEEPER
jgi:hypothetical protein